MADRDGPDPPSPFIVEWAERLTFQRRDALDVAMGRGRNAVPLAARGFHVFGVDRAFEPMRDAMRMARGRGLRIDSWCADLTVSRLPEWRFDLVVVTRYLQRDLFESITRALRSGGVVLYETFTTGQLACGRGPKSPHHLLRPGELAEAFPSLERVFYEEVDRPDALARLVARSR